MKITITGGAGSGKSTIARVVQHALLGAGFSVLMSDTYDVCDQEFMRKQAVRLRSISDHRVGEPVEIIVQQSKRHQSKRRRTRS